MRQIVIPARGGSKGCPRKNVRPLLGEPLISRCVRICKDADADRIVVTTEDAEIADLARRAGAEVSDRPPELATDLARSNDAVAHSLREFPCDQLAIVQCTSPLLDPEDINGCFRGLSPRVDLVVSAMEFHGIVCDESGPINYHPMQNPNRQTRPKQWVVSGHCWVMRPEYLSRPWMSGTLAYHPTQAAIHVEIDTEDDWRISERLLAYWPESVDITARTP